MAKARIPQVAHGQTDSITYRSWHHAKQRCTNPLNDSWDDYGGRGITMSPEWVESFARFLADMGQRPSHKHSLERRENSGNYCKENCYWATRAQQSRNSRRNQKITFQGETLCLQDWATRLGFEFNTLRFRIFVYGWTVERAFTEPVNSSGESSARAKLNAESVRQIRADVASGLDYSAVGKKHGVGSSTVGRIIRGQAWSHVT